MRGIKTSNSGKWKRCVIFGLLLIALIVLLNSVKHVYDKKKTAGETLSRMQKEMDELEARDEYLKDSMEKMKTQEGIEFEMRKKLNVARAGESVAIIVDNEENVSTQTPEISTWQKFKNFFTDLFK